MKRQSTRVMLTALLLCMVMLLSACGAVTRLLDLDDRADRQTDTAQDLISPDGAGDWPAWIPSVIPVYRYGDLVSATNWGDDSGMLIFSNVRKQDDPFNRYVRDLERKGWVAEEGWVPAMTQDEGSVAYMVQDGYFLVYSVVWDDDDPSANITFEKDEEADVATDQDGDKQTVDFGNDDVDVTVSNESIPDGYPQDLCPIYSPSDMMASQKLSDDELTIYVIMLLTKDTEQQVIDFYERLGPDEDMLGFGLIFFESADGRTAVSVQTGPAEEEHTNQGYRTVISISASVEG